MQPLPTQQQVNHVNEHSAYHVINYPYSFGKFCTIRYWVETRKAYGQRLMTQIMDPLTGQWFKAKTDGYFDICIISTIVNPGQPNHGWVVPVQVKLDQFDLDTLNLFATYYTFTPHQKLVVMEALRKFSIHRTPDWNNTLELNFVLIEKSENPQKILGERLTNDMGIAIESQHEADKRAKREKRSQWASAQAAQTQQAEQSGDGLTRKNGRTFFLGEDVTDMSEAEIQIMRDLNS
jgi:hypothetical protein